MYLYVYVLTFKVGPTKHATFFFLPVEFPTLTFSFAQPSLRQDAYTPINIHLSMFISRWHIVSSLNGFASFSRPNLDLFCQIWPQAEPPLKSRFTRATRTRAIWFPSLSTPTTPPAPGTLASPPPPLAALACSRREDTDKLEGRMQEGMASPRGPSLPSGDIVTAGAVANTFVFMFLCVCRGREEV